MKCPGKQEYKGLYTHLCTDLASGKTCIDAATLRGGTLA